jgi:hypothetical protein
LVNLRIMTFFTTLLLAALLHHHPLHVSLTSIDISRENQEATLSFKFFTDDLSLLFFHLYERELRPEPDKDLSPTQLLWVNQYLTRTFQLVSGKDTLVLDYIRKEMNEESIWLYYKTKLPAGKALPLTLTNQLMLDLYEDQTNLVIVNDGSTEQGFTFNYAMRKAEIARGQD